MNRLPLPLSAITATAMFCGLLLLPAGADAESVKTHADGTVTAYGVTYDSLGEWQTSQAFIDNGLRCVSPEPPEIVTQFAPQDCSFSLTSIQPEYEPDAGQEYVIPVVFHVLSTSGGTGDLADSLLTSQIDILNEDFLALAGSPGGPGNNAKISFELASVDPDGNPTNGIDRHAQFFTSPNSADIFAWDPRSYLNIYTADLGGALGYVRSFPQSIAGQQEDGVWLLYTSVGRNSPGGGPFNQGRTATHEVGHYMGLFHTFQGGCGTGYTGGDLIADTTPESGPASGCPAGQSSCGGQLLPYENYMDYSDDRCMDHFSDEQVNRMRCTITHYRTQLFNAKPLAAFDFDNSDDFSFSFTDRSSDADGSVVAWSWDFGDGATSNEQNPAHVFPGYGAYEVRLTVTDDRGVFGTTVQTVAANIDPSADFDYSNTEFTAEFVDQSSDTSPGSIVAWEWDFGDGTTGVSQNPIHAYAAYGTYTVTLTAIDDLGGKATVVKDVEINEGCGCTTSSGNLPWGNIAFFGLAFALIGWRRGRR